MRHKAVLCVMLAVSCFADAQSGGQFAITESVIAGGGVESSNGQFSLGSTSGQTVAGGPARGVGFAVTSGFWNFTPSANPTASLVSVGGQILTADGQGIRNAILSLTAASGAVRTVRSSSFGYYQFEDVAAGETYILSISTKRFTFSEPTVVVNVTDDITGLDFVADPLP